MKRVVLLPTPGDPLVCLLSMAMFKNFENEVDQIHVYLNGDVETSVVEFLRRQYAKHPKVTLEHNRGMVQHGSALSHMAKQHDKDTILMFLEDDAYILKPGSVKREMDWIDLGFGLSGSPRMSSGLNLQKIASKKFNVDLSGYGDVGCAFWPCFFFVRNSLLQQTDMDLNARCWSKGDYIDLLDWTVDDDVCGDTMVWASLQMRNICNRDNLGIILTPQYHTHPFWDSDQREKANEFSKAAFWFHSGSLSGSIYGLLRDKNNRPLAFRETYPADYFKDYVPPDTVQTEGEKREYERRLGMYKVALQCFEEELSEIQDFTNEYVGAIDRVIKQYDLSSSRIDGVRIAYRNLMKL